MHEMALAQGIMDLALDEMRKHNAHGIERIEVEYGALAGIMPEALELAFQTLTMGTQLSGAELVLIIRPLLLRCHACGAEFRGGHADDIWQPCPRCGEDLGHRLVRGRELILKRIHLATGP